MHFCADEIRVLLVIFLAVGGLMKPMNFRKRKAVRKTEAEARNAEYAKLSFEAKLARAGKKVTDKLNKRQR